MPALKQHTSSNSSKATSGSGAANTHSTPTPNQPISTQLKHSVACFPHFTSPFGYEKKNYVGRGNSPYIN
eukprot:1092766-Pelagomonas_calceolata.AAC.1